MDEQTLGRQLQTARQNAGLTQQELCQRAAISYSTLAKIERGAIKAPSIFTVQRLMEVLELSFDSVMGTGKTAHKGPNGRSKTGVSFVYFDINGCLVRFFNRAFVQLARDTGAPADAVEGAFWHFNDQICRGEITIEEFNKLIAEYIGVAHIDWRQYYMGAVDPIREMHEVVKWASEHYRIGLLTNIMPGFIDEMLRDGLLPNLPYEVIIDSSVVGYIKPEKQIYEVAMERAGVPAEEIMLVDDTPGNLMAAERLGWHIIGFDDFRPEESAEHVKHALELAD